MLNECLNKAPKFEWPYAILAEVCIDKRDYNQAAKLLDAAKKLNPKSVPYLLALAKLQASQGNKGTALASIKQALREDPFNHISYQRLLQFYCLEGKTTE